MATKIEVVLVSCGSFNPPTNMHLRMFEIAKNHLNINNISVIKGIMSPCNSGYEKKDLLNGEHRVNMCKLATSDSDWIITDDWEALKMNEFQYTINVLKRFQKLYIKKKVYLLCGADLFLKMCNEDKWSKNDVLEIINNYGLVVISRQDTNLDNIYEKYQYIKNSYNKIHFITSDVENIISSSKLRYLINRNYSIKYLTPQSVIDYINKHNLFKSI